MTTTERLAQALQTLLEKAEWANKIMLHEAGVGVCDVTAITNARAALATWEAEKASEQQAERLSEIGIDQHRKRCTATITGELMPHLFARAIESACAAKWGVKLSSQEGTKP